MNKAFEKILERLDGDSFLTTNDDGETNELSIKVVSFEDAKKIVQEVAEEYNEKLVSIDDVGYMLDNIQMSGNETWMDYYRKALKGLCELSGKEYNGGWIPCSERLPKEGENVLVWYEYFRYGNYNRLYQTIGISYTYRGEWSGFVDGSSGWTDLKIIAWQPLPEPYKERDNNGT